MNNTTHASAFISRFSSSPKCTQIPITKGLLKKKCKAEEKRARNPDQDANGQRVVNKITTSAESNQIPENRRGYNSALKVKGRSESWVSELGHCLRNRNPPRKATP
mmetsp:Transcript_85351/g.165410  ORF Transcript_85351/g.165410 Transcript_85351/m.165410 type:complete len:106 (-) Transcript_85351:1968-2285(-)